MNFKLNTQLNWKTIFIHMTISALMGFMTYSYIRNASRGESGPICQTEKNNTDEKEKNTDKYLNTDKKEKNTDKYLNTDKKDKEEPIILIWTWPYWQRFPLNQCAERYGISGCNFTLDRSWYNRSYAVIFHHRNVCDNKAQLPQIPRPETQRWVWFNMESPRHSPNMHFMENLMNLTMSYRFDSAIFTPYGSITILNETHEFIIPNKTKLVAWMVSNWDPTLVRVAYYNELKKHLNIDMYGARHRRIAQEKILSTIAPYKFYLAFENSLATDYISEKFWRNALMSGTVPVVLGTTRANYEQFMPGDAFIHVNDFPSAKELAAHLHYLDSNDEQYRRYFRWRKWYQPFCDEGDWAKYYCTACKALKESPTFKIFPNISKWYTNPNTLWG